MNEPERHENEPRYQTFPLIIKYLFGGVTPTGGHNGPAILAAEVKHRGVDDVDSDQGVSHMDMLRPHLVI